MLLNSKHGMIMRGHRQISQFPDAMSINEFLCVGPYHLRN